MRKCGEKRGPVYAPINIYSSVGGGAFSERMYESWEQSGWPVRRFQVVPDERYRNSAGHLRRLYLRWSMYGGSGMKWAASTLWANAERPINLVTTNPFFGPSLIRCLTGNNGLTINWVFDLFPDALVLGGVIEGDSWLARSLARISAYAIQRCDMTVFLGEQLREHAERRYGPAKRALVIPIGADGRPFVHRPPIPATKGETITMLYAGQLGAMHDTETIVQAWKALKPGGLRMAFHASGSGYHRLRRQLASSPNCELRGPLPADDWVARMSAAQVALVSMAAGAERVVMPSKTYSALMAGQAILGICESSSDLAALIRRHECGWVIEPGNVPALLRCFDEIVGDPIGLHEKRQRAFAAGHAHYDSGVLAQHWEGVFQELVERSGRDGPII